jgi:hypothetical protein
MIWRRDPRVCVFITAGPSTKMFTWGGRGYAGTRVGLLNIKTDNKAISIKYILPSNIFDRIH